MDNYRNFISLVTLPLLLSLNAKSANAAEDYFINQSFRNCAIDNFAFKNQTSAFASDDLIYNDLMRNSASTTKIELFCCIDFNGCNPAPFPLEQWENCYIPGETGSSKAYPAFCSNSNCYIRKDENVGCVGSYTNDKNVKNPILIPKSSVNLDLNLNPLLQNLTTFTNNVNPVGLKKGYKSYNLNNCNMCDGVISCNLENNGITTCFANNTGNYGFIKFNKNKVLLPAKTTDSLTKTTSSSKETLSPTETKTSNGNSLLSKGNLIKSISFLSGVFSFLSNF